METNTVHDEIEAGLSPAEIEVVRDHCRVPSRLLLDDVRISNFTASVVLDPFKTGCSNMGVLLFPENGGRPAGLLCEGRLDQEVLDRVRGYTRMLSLALTISDGRILDSIAFAKVTRLRVRKDPNTKELEFTIQYELSTSQWTYNGLKVLTDGRDLSQFAW